MIQHVELTTVKISSHKWDKVNERLEVSPLDIDKVLPPNRLRKTVTELAYITLDRSTAESLSFTGVKVYKTIDKIIDDAYRYDKRDIADKLVTYLKERAGFRPDVQYNGDNLAFHHRILRDYFAMIHIKETINRAVKFVKDVKKDEIKLSVVPLIVSGFYFQNQLSYSKRIMKQAERQKLNLLYILIEIHDLGVDLPAILDYKDISNLLVKLSKSFMKGEKDLAILKPMESRRLFFRNYLFNINWKRIKQLNRHKNWEKILLGLFNLFTQDYSYLSKGKEYGITEVLKEELFVDFEKRQILIKDWSSITKDVQTTAINKNLYVTFDELIFLDYKALTSWLDLINKLNNTELLLFSKIVFNFEITNLDREKLGKILINHPTSLIHTLLFYSKPTNKYKKICNFLMNLMINNPNWDNGKIQTKKSTKEDLHKLGEYIFTHYPNLAKQAFHGDKNKFLKEFFVSSENEYSVPIFFTPENFSILLSLYDNLEIKQNIGIPEEDYFEVILYRLMGQ